ncbi:MAG: T9SS type A sorting domain-containing protein [Parafilimonas sp.]|nr:T9SS type A sorting domain-containing protein [Parafilimonas sp.]
MKTDSLNYLSKIIFSLLSISSLSPVTAQNLYEWTWVSGFNTSNPIAEYGTKGRGSINNTPGGREKSISWTDKKGNFWIYGGDEGYNGTTIGIFNDLWKFSPKNNQWTWISGGKKINQSVIYGEKNVGSASNSPGSRREGASWVDKSGNLWLFGGWGYKKKKQGDFNDLWKFDITTNEWTWINGDSVQNKIANYGTKGKASLKSKPGARWGAISWVDKSNNLWMFGGFGFSQKDSGDDFLNDLWKYDIDNNKWTWVSGDSISSVSSIYGIKNVSSPTNRPGSRIESASCIDANGNLWMFGGSGLGAGTHNSLLNDLWKYDISSKQWTWVSGDSLTDSYGVYGTKQVESSGNKIGARTSSAMWVDKNGIFWIFGGYGYGYITYGFLNDLWNYNSSTKNWTWYNGSNAGNSLGHYGTKGVGSPSNTPGGRNFFCRFSDTTGNIWIFGGNGESATGYGLLNDLWKIKVSNTSVNQADASLNHITNFKENIEKNIINLEINPNPVSDKLNLKIYCKNNDKINLEIIDINGRVFYSKKDMIISGANTISLPINFLSSDVYFLRITSKNDMAILKWIKQ